ncbi:hypothetical protein B0A50_01718 [Salinomyces thailandicus]|uniref:Uncharacterized protein n=1 Tax=Salinomyces thailandicus TaxID=706561 RepID=A0A4U0U8L8_9PEZI|nr:hypothetical protein B0A50_01718 [Salinomyces thailandica]
MADAGKNLEVQYCKILKRESSEAGILPEFHCSDFEQAQTLSELGSLVRHDPSVLLHLQPDICDRPLKGRKDLRAIGQKLRELDECQDMNELLVVAAEYGLEELGSSLLEHGADVNYQDSTGRSILHAACENMKLPLVWLLVESGADVTIADASGKTPLMIAAGLNLGPVISALVDGRADLSCLYLSSIAPPLIQLLHAGDMEAAKALVRGGSSRPEGSGPDGDGTLHYAVKAGDTTMIELLLDKNVDIRALNGELHTALVVAANHEQPRALRLLLEHRAGIVFSNELTLLAALLEEKSLSEAITELLDDQ